MKSLILLTTLFTVTLGAIDIGVYYESKCPDSRRFINNQVTMVKEKFGNNVNIILFPFGKANVSRLFYFCIIIKLKAQFILINKRDI